MKRLTALPRFRVRLGICLGALAVFVTFAGDAAAQPAVEPAPNTGTPNHPPPETAPVQPVNAANPTGVAAVEEASTDLPVEAHHAAPKARTGFQVAIRVGAAVPLGDAAKDIALADSFGTQFAGITDIGGKIIPQLFLGAYLGANVGATGGVAAKACDLGGASCIAFTYRIGLQAHYHILPDGKVDPWIGYGIGYEVSRFAGTASGTTFSQTAVGPEYGHLLAGVDFRLTRIFGIGPFVDFSVGQYSHITTEPGNGDGEIKDKAMHQWLTVGAKFLFFP